MPALKTTSDDSSQTKAQIQIMEYTFESISLFPGPKVHVAGPGQSHLFIFYLCLGKN